MSLCQLSLSQIGSTIVILIVLSWRLRLSVIVVGLVFQHAAWTIVSAYLSTGAARSSPLFKQRVVLDVGLVARRWGDHEERGALRASFLSAGAWLSVRGLDSWTCPICPVQAAHVVMKRAKHYARWNFHWNGRRCHIVFNFIRQILAIALLLRVYAAHVFVHLPLLLMATSFRCIVSNYVIVAFGHLVYVTRALWTFAIWHLAQISIFKQLLV